MIDKSSFKGVFILCVYVFDLNVCMCAMCVAPADDRRGTDLLELAMNGGKLPYMYFGNHTQVLCKSSKLSHHCTISSASCKKLLTSLI